VYEAAIRGMEELLNRPQVDAREAALLRRNLAADYFWRLGYTAHWQNGNHRAAFAAFRRGLRLDPWRLAYWKTYGVASVRSWLPAPRQRQSAAL
jgi:hypothetical protein